jgi:hypothetical protein
MDFSKLAAQRAAKEKQAAEPAATEKAPRRQGGSRSKRQDWKAATFYLRPETLQQLRRIVGMRKLEGGVGDLSDAVEEALQTWINQQGRQPPR